MSPTNGSAAPVCPISRSQAAPAMPGVRVPKVPKAIDLASAIVAANALADALRQLLANQRPVVNNIYLPGTPTSGGLPTWTEKSRIVRRLKFTNPNDPDQWIVVERIVHIQWHDNVLGTDLVFTWPPEPGAQVVG